MLAGGYSRTRFNRQPAPGSHTTTDSRQVRDWLGDRHHPPPGARSRRNLLPLASGPGPARSGLGRIDARRQLERELHDAAQNEIDARIIKLTRAEQDSGTPRAIADHARSILDSVRQVACGIYRPMFADSGLVEALRAQAERASVHMSLAGTAPRSIQPAETALFFSCLEAIQNVANHAGRTAHASLGPHHEHGVLAVRVEDEGRGFDSEHTPDGACGPEDYSRAQPSARRHRHAHLRPWARHRLDDFTAAAAQDSRKPQATAIPVRNPNPDNGNLTTLRDARRQ